MCVCVHVCAVGATGHVYSFESIPRHMEAAKRNYSKWRANWAIGRESEWPDNVTFVQEDVKEAGVHITRPVDYVSPRSESSKTHTHTNTCIQVCAHTQADMQTPCFVSVSSGCLHSGSRTINLVSSMRKLKVVC